jgi:hypothetical protein
MVTGGSVNVLVVAHNDPPQSTPLVVGGGSVAVLWPAGLIGASAVFVDVVFANNTLTSVVSGSVASNGAGVYVGGGGLYVAGNGNDSVVVLQDCFLVGNAVSVVDHTGQVGVFGGGAFVSWGLATSSAVQSGSLSHLLLTVEDVIATSNSIMCSLGCMDKNGTRGSLSCARRMLAVYGVA